MPRPSPLIEVVTAFYLESRDFNGMPALMLERRGAVRWRSTAKRLVRAQRIEVLTERTGLNPHIKRLPAPDVDDQVRSLDEATDSAHICLYPHPRELAVRVDRARYADRPYDLALALGAAQLEHRAFDLAVLEHYRNDPRYRYECDDLHGSISISDEHYRSEAMPTRDKVLLPTFGFGYDDKLGRAVVTFCRYLADLSPEHQRIWQAHELTTPVRMLPDFFRTQVIGDFPENLSLCEAFFMELETINAMATAMGRPPLFRSVERPKKFGFLLRPTHHEFEQFVHLLDKTLSDNLSRKFFGSDVAFERERARPDGKVQVEQKGTLQILDEWLRLKWRAPDMTPVDEMIGVFKEIRRLRQAPAHAVTDDAFDVEVTRRQRKLLLDAYNAVRLLRLIFANHPAAKTVRVDPFLFEGKINSF